MYRTAHSFKFPISVKQNQSVEITIPDMADDCTGQIRPLEVLFGFVHKLWQARNWNTDNKIVTAAFFLPRIVCTYQTSVVQQRIPGWEARLDIRAYFRFCHSSSASWSVDANLNCVLPCFLTICLITLAAFSIATVSPCILKNKVSSTGYALSTKPALLMAAITVTFILEQHRDL